MYEFLLVPKESLSNQICELACESCVPTE